MKALHIGKKIVGYYIGDVIPNMEESWVDVDGVVSPDMLPKKYWVDNGEVKPKQHFTLDNVPLPATAIIEYEHYALTEQPTFEFSEPGQYEVSIDAGPAYYVETFTIDYPA